MPNRVRPGFGWPASVTRSPENPTQKLMEPALACSSTLEQPVPRIFGLIGFRPVCGAAGSGFTQPMEPPSVSFQPGAGGLLDRRVSARSPHDRCGLRDRSFFPALAAQEDRRLAIARPAITLPPAGACLSGPP